MERRISWSDSFRSLKPKDKAKIIVAVGVVIFLIVAFLVLLGAGKVRGSDGASYPSHGLAQIGDFQTDNVREPSANLPILLQFPGTPYGIYVGGEAIGSSEKSVLYDYSENTKLMLSVDSVAVSFENVLLSQYASHRGIDPKTISYVPEVVSGGYLNARYYSYYCGEVVIDDGKNYEKCYTITYQYTTAEGKRLYVSSFTHDPGALRSDRDLLVSMLKTFRKFVESSNTDTGTTSH